jgi:hypothetical protein
MAIPLRFGCFALLFVAACGSEAGEPVTELPLAAGEEPFAAACQVDPKRELLVTDLSVVEDPVRTAPGGAWSFQTLIQTLAGDHDPSQFVLGWLSHYAGPQLVNGFNVAPRPLFDENITQIWKRRSEENGVEGLDLSIAPFRLNGFAHRLDLRQCEGGHVKSAGEGRIIFTILDFQGGSEGNNRGTLILEYHLKASSCSDVKRWANAFHALGSIPLGTPEYNTALEKVVRMFSGPNAMLAQLRTNELIGDFFPWEWREFQLDSDGWLRQSTVARTVATELNHDAKLANFINQNEAAILSGDFDVPLAFEGKPFRGGASDGDPITLHFSADGVNSNEARHRLSFNACVGCHTEETSTGLFHVGPRAEGNESSLSGFLTGTVVPDPVEPKTIRKFNDLERRSRDLCHVLATHCQSLVLEPSSKQVH